MATKQMAKPSRAYRAGRLTPSRGRPQEPSAK